MTKGYGRERPEGWEIWRVFPALRGVQNSEFPNFALLDGFRHLDRCLTATKRLTYRSHAPLPRALWNAVGARIAPSWLWEIPK